jgi:CheY-like chemotaxis protein
MKANRKSKRRVLLFDDNDLVRSTLRELLAGHGYEVFSFPDPEVCPLHQAQSCTCQDHEACADVIVTDQDMAHISGLEFLAELKQKGCKIREMAMLSGTSDEAVLRRAAELGCQAFRKPEQIPAFLEWLDQKMKEVESARKLTRWDEAPPPKTGAQ